MELSLFKMHGSKNTFYLLDINNVDDFDYISLTKWLCNRANNGGADGLLLVLPSEVAYAKMRVINADGSEASMCGNGLRCVARYICERDELSSTLIETMKAVLNVQKEDDLIPSIPTYSVEISPVSFNLETLPMQYEQKTKIKNEILPIFSSEILFTSVSVPNPHLIGIVNKHYIENMSHQFLLASFLNNENQYTPDGINVSYVYPLSSSEIFVRTFERGVGFTNACGTAMTASALVANINGYIVEEDVTVYNPGGFVKCLIKINDEQYTLRLKGNATYIEKVVVHFQSNHYEIEVVDRFIENEQYDLLMESYQKELVKRIQFT